MNHSRTWNWQQDDWPAFRFESARLEKLESEFLFQAGVFTGVIKHFPDEERRLFVVDVMSDEALNTSEIEGELLNRESLQSSIRRNFGLPSDNRKIPPAESGVSEMMVDLYVNFSEPLSDTVLFRWHEMLMNGRRDLVSIGEYRKGGQPMQIVSGPLHNPKVHFEGPPSSSVRKEMRQFIQWFNKTASGGKSPMPPLARAGIAHWYFVSIHPFEDGNGRIARALAEKALSQSLGQPAIIALSHVINAKRDAYYEVLERENKHNEISGWLEYFSQTILDGLKFTQSLIEFLMEKAKFFDRLRGQLNERQTKVLLRMFKEGPKGFKGGLSAENYISISGASRATATRDLADMVEKGALTKSGELKSTRYQLLL